MHVSSTARMRFAGRMRVAPWWSGALLFAVILGNITSMVQSFDRHNAELSRKTNNITSWAQGRLVTDTQRRLHQYVNQYSTATRGINEAELVSQVAYARLL